MSTPVDKRTSAREHAGERRMDARGFTLIEILIGITILAVGLLGVAGMFSTAYVDVNAGGKTTMAVTAARQIVEDLRLLPFPDVAALNGFNTNSAPPTSPPLSPAALAMARKWRYMVAGDGAGWNFTTAEKQEWRMLSTGGPATGGTVVFGGNAVIQVLSTSPTLRQVTVTVPVPGRGVNVSIATLISSL